MNERIKELARQAGLAEAADWAPGYIYPAGTEKFAELLLKASFDVVINDGLFHDAKGIIRAGKYTAMKHFGVKE